MKLLVSKAMVDAADEYISRPLPPEARFYDLLPKPEKDRLRRQLIRGLLIAALKAGAQEPAQRDSVQDRKDGA